jgi:hypothetical protein
MRAMLDGDDWAASSNAVQVSGSASPTPQGSLTILGIDVPTGRSVTLTLSYVTGPDTYRLGVNTITNAGGVGSVSDNPDGWLTPLNSTAGTATITVRTATRIAGSFEFTAEHILGTAPDIVVTEGEFDITVSGGLPPLPTANPSVISATFAGEPWYAATVVGVSPGFSFSGSTTGYAVSMVPLVPIAPGGAYDIGSEFSAMVSELGTGASWSTTIQDSVGYVAFVTVTADRVQGFFGGTLPVLAGATSPLAIESGFFTVHLD